MNVIWQPVKGDLLPAGQLVYVLQSYTSIFCMCSWTALLVTTAILRWRLLNHHRSCCFVLFRQLLFDLPRQQWSLLNRFHTEQGHCGACRRKWQLTDTDLCPCGETQTMSHIVESCPLTKLNGGLSRLHSADEDAVSWLTNYGKWHAYEKKKKFVVLTVFQHFIKLLVRNYSEVVPVVHKYCWPLFFPIIACIFMALLVVISCYWSNGDVSQLAFTHFVTSAINNYFFIGFSFLCVCLPFSHISDTQVVNSHLMCDPTIRHDS